jgi:hypothetical protein
MVWPSSFSFLASFPEVLRPDVFNCHHLSHRSANGGCNAMMRKIDFILMKIITWMAAFVVCSNFLENYENIILVWQIT